MTFKKIEVVMLPTEDESNILVNTIIGLNSFPSYKKNFTKNAQFEEKRGYKHQHLYITSDEEIKEGDWVLDIELQRIFTSHKDQAKHVAVVFKKIITTTDPKLTFNGKLTPKWEVLERHNYVPQIPQSFIELWCKLGGKGEFEVEYVDWCDYDDDDPTGLDRPDVRLKVNSDNTIKIRPIEEKMYSKKEVYLIIQRFTQAHPLQRGVQILNANITNWIADNL